MTFLSSIDNFKDFRQEVLDDYEATWVEDVFKFGTDVVDFGDIHEFGGRWLRCKSSTGPRRGATV